MYVRVVSQSLFAISGLHFIMYQIHVDLLSTFF